MRDIVTLVIIDYRCTGFKKLTMNKARDLMAKRASNILGGIRMRVFHLDARKADGGAAGQHLIMIKEEIS